MNMTDRFENALAAADGLRSCASQWGIPLREAGRLLGLSSLYISAILIGIACRQLELLQTTAIDRDRR